MPGDQFWSRYGEWIVIGFWLLIAGEWLWKKWKIRTGRMPPPGPDKWGPIKFGRLVRPGRRILQDRFPSWPKIYVGGSAARPVVTLVARHASPQSMKSARLMALGSAALFGLWIVTQSALPVPGDDAAWLQANVGPVLGGVIGGALSILVFRFVYRHVLWRVPLLSYPLVMRFADGGIRWKGQQRGLFNPKRKGRVLPGEVRAAERIVPHRQAGQELRGNDERRRRGFKPKPMFFQQCSEVIMFVGPDRETYRPVAELANDEQGQWAHGLASAIYAADALALSLLPRQDAAEAPRRTAPVLPAPVMPLQGRAEPEEPGGLLE